MADSVETRLGEVAVRVERIAVEPERVTAPWTMRLARPFYRLLGWQPELSVSRTNELLAELRRIRQGELDACRDELELALAELESNVEVAERACMVNGRLPIAQLAWLSRLTRVLAQAAHALDGELDQPAAIAAAFDPVLVAPPLTVATVPKGAEEAAQPPGDMPQQRLVDLELAAIDHIIEAARAEGGVLERRRRLLEAARRLLLDADAALRLDADGVRLRKRYLTQQIVQADRLQACGLSPHVSLLHQARSAVARGERGRLHAALVAMEGYATAAGDLRGASAAKRALAALDADGATRGADALQHSLARSVGEVMGEDVIASVQRAYVAARETFAKQGASERDEETYRLAIEYLAPGAEAATLSALLSVDGCFDVGAPLAPVRIEERRIVARVVEHPTQELMLTHAQGVDDVSSAVISDPRGVLLDLAAGRLLARKYIRYEERKVERIEMMGEVRVYLLDGSTSMLEDPARARMRDAILTAELATLMSRFDKPDRFTRVLMFYRYFTKRIWPLHRVSTAAEALAAIGEVHGRQWDGGTNIERALITSFDMIREARVADADLARGQVVLITDGEASVSEETVREARERVGEIPVAVSVIALGQENAALRQLVARQRARGERAFYHFIDDQTLKALIDGDLGAARALHLVDEDEAPMSRAELESAVGDVLDEAAALERDRHQLLLNPPPDLEAAFAELGLPASMMSDGQRALHEASERDRRAVEKRYRQWFPPVAEVAIAAADGEKEDAVVLVLSTVAEVVSELGDDELWLKADAIDVLERLLPDARLSPAQYDALLREPTARVAGALQAVHDITARARGRS